MTTISIPGKITAIEIDESPEIDFAIVPLTPDYLYQQPQTDPPGPQNPPVIIYPSGKKYTIVLPGYLAFPPSAGPLKLDSSFQIGDIVEVYIVSNTGDLKDENGNSLGGGSGLGHGIRLRKIATGTTFPTWGII